MQECEEKYGKRCAMCRYWLPYSYEFDETSVDADYGECRRYPPRAVPAEEVGFPITHEDMWCGEFDT